MSSDTQQIVNRAWNYAHVLRDDGLSYMAYTEQITFLLFLKMADELTRPPYNRAALVPAKYGWPSLLKLDGAELETHYRTVLEELGKKPGMLGEVFKKARMEIQNPATLKRLITDLIDSEQWTPMDSDVKGDIYEGLLARSAAESPKGTGQYFTPRELIKAVVDVMRPTPDDTVVDPAVGTGGFLLAAHKHVVSRFGGDFYAQGVKANVLFFDAKPAREAAWTKTLWVYDLRTNMHFTQKTFRSRTCLPRRSRTTCKRRWSSSRRLLTA
jgi:type I restriction enzyme M protein